MNKLWIIVLSIAFHSQAFAYDYWNDIRHSALLPDSSIVIRIENSSGFGVENYLLYSVGSVVEQAMIPVADGGSTVSAIVPGPAAASRYYGFRLIQGGELDFMPVFLSDGANPKPIDLTRLATDPLGDHLFANTNLDLVDCRVSFSDRKIFAALKNVGGGFPVNQGLTFFGYLLAIADPALADPDTLFALMQTYSQPGVISPGLYKITGTGFSNLNKIGEISVREYPSSHSLLLSCDLADLLDDPYFQSWFDDKNRTLGMAGFTQRITLIDGALEADRTAGGRCHLREFPITPSENMLPELTGLSIMEANRSAYAQIQYFDPNGNCPVVAEIAFDEEPPCPMYPQSLDYSLPVVYRTGTGIAPLVNDSWSRAVARFSDNLSDTVTVAMTSTGLSDDQQTAAPPHVQLFISPNPSNSTATLSYTLPAQNIMSKVEGEGTLNVEPPTFYVTLKVFNVLGQEVAVLVDGVQEAGYYTVTWDSSDMSSGVYFCRLTAGGTSRDNRERFTATRQMVRMR